MKTLKTLIKYLSSDQQQKVLVKYQGIELPYPELIPELQPGFDWTRFQPEIFPSGELFGPAERMAWSD